MSDDDRAVPRSAEQVDRRKPQDLGTLTAPPSMANNQPDDSPSAESRPAMRADGAPREPSRYQIVCEHGRGGLGRVFRARDLNLDRDVALKELISRGPTSERRFMREAMITARLEHPGIVPIHQVGTWPDGTPFYAMKLVAGRPLRELIEERTTVNERIELLHHVLAVADAIAYAHERNVVHRDLKPANVIVGDFGETIVIDWGLAKELPAEADTETPYVSMAQTQNSRLTSTGAVLGTPAYMAPEQEKGEHIDQRVDVFAIGAMLWELCALQRVPPMDLSLRRRILRHNGISADLATIINKALNPDRDLRYHNAGALAADLKAFKAGARIAARAYTTIDVLRHWLRRHRGSATISLLILTMLPIAVAFYVTNITAERDHATVLKDSLALEHADLLLRSDPSAAHRLLESYNGTNARRAAMLRAQAEGIGIDIRHSKPHTQAIYIARLKRDRTIISLSSDGAIIESFPNGTTNTIQSNASLNYVFDYNDNQSILAYTCNSHTVCLLNLETRRLIDQSLEWTAIQPADIAFSPSGALLAILSAQGRLSLWTISANRSPSLVDDVQAGHGDLLIFIDEHNLAIKSPTSVEFYNFAIGANSLKYISRVSLLNSTDVAIDQVHKRIGLGTTDGKLVAVDAITHETIAKVLACKGFVNRIASIGSLGAFAYACQDGDAGIWDLSKTAASVFDHLDGGASIVATSVDSRYVIAGGVGGHLAVYDLYSSLTTTYLGHTARITALSTAANDRLDFVSGDASGAIRVWPLPDGGMRVVATTGTRMIKAVSLQGGGPLVAVNNSATIPWYARDGTSGLLTEHAPQHILIAVANANSMFALYGSDNAIEIWTMREHPSMKTLVPRHGTITAATFGPDDSYLLIGFSDGAIEHWPVSGGSSPSLFASVEGGVAFIRPLSATSSFVVISTKGSIFIATPNQLHHLWAGAGDVVSAVISRDRRWLAVGTSLGNVNLYDLVTSCALSLGNNLSTIEHMAFSPEGSELAVAVTERLLTYHTDSARLHCENGTASWHPTPSELPLLDGQHIAYSDDGKWRSTTGTNGSIWLYDRILNVWHFRYVQGATIRYGQFRDDSAEFVATDASGRAITVDLQNLH